MSESVERSAESLGLSERRKALADRGGFIELSDQELDAGMFGIALECLEQQGFGVVTELDTDGIVRKPFTA